MAFAARAGSASPLRYLSASGIALWALVMALGPDPGFAAPGPWMALFWALQIAAGLVVLQSVLYLMSRSARLRRWPLWLLVVVSGVLGAAVLAPVYWLIGEGLMQTVLGFAETVDDDGDTGLPLAFGLPALLQEFGDIVGPVTASWVLLSWPRLQGLVPPLVTVPAQAVPAIPSPPKPSPPTPFSPTPFSPPPSASHPPVFASEELAPVPAPTTPLPTVAAPAPAAAPMRSPAWRTGLPPELGDDLIAVSSELQYLRVWTTRGCALVLGALQEVEAAEGHAGMRVHRSWWVHARHVRSVRGRGDGAVCTLSDGREVPVSRRRKAEVLARFGDGASYRVAPPAQAATPATPATPDRAQNERRRPS